VDRFEGEPSFGGLVTVEAGIPVLVVVEDLDGNQLFFNYPNEPA
jgi:hypothetical protein